MGPISASYNLYQMIIAYAADAEARNSKLKLRESQIRDPKSPCTSQMRAVFLDCSKILPSRPVCLLAKGSATFIHETPSRWAFNEPYALLHGIWKVASLPRSEHIGKQIVKERGNIPLKNNFKRSKQAGLRRSISKFDAQELASRVCSRVCFQT
jgi:hypothetical protein